MIVSPAAQSMLAAIKAIGGRGGALWSFGRRFMVAALEALFPIGCLGCGRLFQRHGHGSDPSGAANSDVTGDFGRLMGSCVCPSCARSFSEIRSPLCPLCGMSFVSMHGPDHACGQCSAQPFRFQAARAIGHHEGILKTAIHHYKYGGREHLAGPLGRLLWKTVCSHWDPRQIDRIVPVPLHPRRLRRRGFNQAELLVRRWPAYAAADLAITPPPDWIAADVLIRRHYTQPQTGLKKEQRARNMRDAFDLTRKKDLLRGMRVLLVDDVLTTGATADACAEILQRAGAAEVRLLTLARAVREGRMLWVADNGSRYWQFPSLNAVDGIWHGIFARFVIDAHRQKQSLDIGLNGGRPETHIWAGRRLMLSAAGAGLSIFARQVHGTQVAQWHGCDDAAIVENCAAPYVELQGDALVTAEPDAALVIQTADCQSVIMVDPAQRVVANVHSGWRGSIRDIIGRTVHTMVDRFGCRPARLVCGIGPSLGPCCAEFIHYREEIPAQYWSYRLAGDHFDFWRLSVDQLAAAGVPRSQIAVSGMCTRCNPHVFFSYRGEGARAGRFAAVIRLLNS